MPEFDQLAELHSLYLLTRESITSADPDKRAPLIARAESIAKQIVELTPTAKKGDPVDEIAQRRTARGAGSATSRRSAGADQG